VALDWRLPRFGWSLLVLLGVLIGRIGTLPAAYLVLKAQREAARENSPAKPRSSGPPSAVGPV
jgi:hypothetical protein